MTHPQKEQMEFREFWIKEEYIGRNSGTRYPPTISREPFEHAIHVVEIAKVRELEERLLEATKWADTYQKKYELSYAKISRLESENLILRDGPEKEAKWNKGSYSSERLLDVLDKADALRSEGKSE